MEMNDNTDLHPDILQNKNPYFLVKLYEEVLLLFTNYGWYFLFVLLGLLYIYSKIQPHVEKYLKKKAEREYDAKYHKNSDLYHDRLSAIEKTRQKMQENLNVAAEEYKEKLILKEEKRRELFLQQTEGFSGNRLGNGKKDTEKKSFKSDYNPLMGSGSSGYRAPKRSACGSGGCGKK